MSSSGASHREWLFYSDDTIMDAEKVLTYTTELNQESVVGRGSGSVTPAI